MGDNGSAHAVSVSDPHIPYMVHSKWFIKHLRYYRDAYSVLYDLCACEISHICERDILSTVGWIGVEGHFFLFGFFCSVWGEVAIFFFLIFYVDT